MARTRSWLRGFLRLDARAGATVSMRAVERQEDTVLRALACLDERPGVVLADEVGLGKTYEALGMLAARLQEHPNGRSLILTPGPDLNQKWCKELRGFGSGNTPMFAGFIGKFAAATTLAELVTALQTHQIVVAPVTVFIGGRGHDVQRYLLSLWGWHYSLAGNQLAAIFNHYRDGKLSRIDVEQTRFLESFSWKEVKPLVHKVLREHAEQKDSINAIWQEGPYEAFANVERVGRALEDLRFRLIGHLLPPMDLLIVDEAHKLKSADSVRVKGVHTAFARRFEKAVFLTATPFQLTVEELRQVFVLFGLARSAPAELMGQAELLLDDVAEYTQAYAQLERVWALADEGMAADFASWFAEDPELRRVPDEVALQPIAAAAGRLLTLKREKIEPGFRRWMIRSLREDKRQYRRTRRTQLRPAGGAGVPFLLYERFIGELFRSGRQTHKAAAQINMVSSYSAAREGALLGERDEPGKQFDAEPEAYRRLLKGVVEKLSRSDEGHPKVDHVVKEVLDAVHRDEKTLIFCTRIETLRELKLKIEKAWEQRLLASWRRSYPGASEAELLGGPGAKSGGTKSGGRQGHWRDRFNDPRDALSMALRERYVSTRLGGWAPEPEQLELLIARANEILQKQLVAEPQAKAMHWPLAKRCVEHAAACLMRELGCEGELEEEAMTQLTDARFVALGYDLVEDEVEGPTRGSHPPAWKIGAEQVEVVLRHEHLWAYLTSTLHEVPPELRVRTVERLASYLTRRNVLFLSDVIAYAHDQGLELEGTDGKVLLQLVDGFWTSPQGRPWCDLLRRFLLYLASLDEALRYEVLDDILPSADLVRHTVEGESRERLREAFNTPLFPMVLVANEVMQEGLDLHHHCRRVIHHDLPWNPAQLEQRVGRVDRLGSLVQRLRVRQPEVTLDVMLPLIARTIDERLDHVVRQRERWLEFLLGAAPQLEEYSLDDDPPLPLPEAFAQALRVELGPTPVR